MDSATKQVYADGIGEITLSGGMIRMDLVTMVGSQNNKDNPAKMEVRERIVMPPDGFLRSFSAMENLVKQLVEAGLVKPRDGENPVAAASGGSQEPPKSPNFG